MLTSKPSWVAVMTYPNAETLVAEHFRNDEHPIEYYLPMLAGKDKRFKKNVKKVTIKKNTATKKTVSGLKKGKTYYVRIRTYKKANQSTLYSKWSAFKTVKIKAK